MKIDLIASFVVKSLIGIIETLLGIRFFLKVLGASEQAPFVQWIYSTSAAFLEPFWGMFPTLSLGRYFVIELSTMFAMFVYALFGFFTLRLVVFGYKQIIDNFTDTPTVESKKQQKPAEKSHSKQESLRVPRSREK